MKLYLILNWEKDENKIKRGRDWPILKHVGTFYDSPSLTLFVSYYLFLNSIHSLTVQSHSLSLTFSHTIQYLSFFYLSSLLFITQKHFLHFTFSLSFAFFTFATCEQKGVCPSIGSLKTFLTSFTMQWSEPFALPKIRLKTRSKKKKKSVRFSENVRTTFIGGLPTDLGIEISN